MKWSAVITTYNSAPVIRRAIDSILSLDQAELPEDIVVVDNNSSDDTADILKSYADKLTLKLNTANNGLPRANNAGASLARGDSLFFINPDVELLPGAVSALSLFQLQHPEAALIGPGMVDGSGTLQHTARTWPSPSVIAARRTRFAGTRLGRCIVDDHLNRFFSSNEPVMPQWLVGAALWLTPRGRSKIGLMSERYFLYFEDVEWCYRAWKRSMEVWYVPSAVIRHVCRRESSSGGPAMKHHLKSMFRFLISHPGITLGIGPRRRTQ